MNLESRLRRAESEACQHGQGRCVVWYTEDNHGDPQPRPKVGPDDLLIVVERVDEGVKHDHR